jgi:uncharacterized protein YndB with AHSA1/START domain
VNEGEDHPASEESVVVEITISADPATVWLFLSEADRFASWIGAFAGQQPLEGTSVDPRVGGEIRVAYTGGHAALGRITTMEPPHRIVFTWGYSNATHGLPPGSSRVEITLRPIPEGTRVRLSHSGIPGEETRQGHRGGWNHYLSMLAREAAALQHHEAARRAFEAYFHAWAEPEAGARRQMLASCCEPGVRVRTSFACTDDVDQLSEHIAGSLRHMAGMSFRAEGQLETVHGHARVRWTVSAPDARVILRGEIFAVLSLGGRLEQVVSFPDPPC